MSQLIILLIVLPFLGSAFSLLEKIYPALNISRWMAPFTLAGAGLCLFRLYPVVVAGTSMTYPLGNWGPPFGIVLVMDGLAWLSVFTILVISLPILLYALAQRTYGPAFYFFFQMMAGGMIGLVLTDDIFNMFVFFEILALSAYVLIAYLKKPRAVLAALKYLFISSLGISFFLIGIFLLYKLTGTLSLRAMADILGAAAPLSASLARQFVVALVCLLVGLGVRMAILPFHAWLPEAHASAPHPVSALLSALLIKTALIVLWRIASVLDLWDRAELLLWMGAGTALLAACWTLAQNDAKKLLAYSSISQMGYLLAALGAASGLSRVAAFHHLFNHALFKSLLFLAVGNIILCTGERKLDRLGNLGRTLPLTAIPLAIACLAIAGVPPFNGYAGKQLMAEVLKGHPAYLLLTAASIFTVASFLKLSGMLRSTGKPLPDKVAQPVRPPLGLVLPLWVLSLACILTGLFPAVIAGKIGDLLSVSIPPVHVYHPAALVDAALLIGAGVLLHLATGTQPALIIQKTIRAHEVGLRGALILLIAGFILLGAIAHADVDVLQLMRGRPF